MKIFFYILFMLTFVTYISIFFYCLISAGINEWTHEYLKSIGELFIRLQLIGLPALIILCGICKLMDDD